MPLFSVRSDSGLCWQTSPARALRRSRLAQAAVEQHHDDSGICWPTAIAPFEAIVVVAIQDETQAQLGEALYSELQNAGVDVLIDDRKERAGVKFKDADLIGIPWRIVVGRDASEAVSYTHLTLPTIYSV